MPSDGRVAGATVDEGERGRGGFGLLLACFFLSGLAALIYQTAWTRQFSFVFGTSELAIATVLAAYMGGLSLGAAVAARFAPRVRRPVWVYGLLELGIAASALAVPFAIRGARWLYLASFGQSGALPAEGGLWSALFYLVCTFAILALPTALMGATLPLLARHAVRHEHEIGPRIGWLYATNTVGAVAGTVLAGFFLLPAVGLARTVWIAAGTNALVFGVAVWLARSAPLPVDDDGAQAAAAARGKAAGTPTASFILPVIALSGFVSFSYEVLWSRLLGHVTGGSVYAFATMLATFLTGIALGSAFAARRARDRESSLRGFVLAQVLTALFSLLAFYALDSTPAWMRALREAGSVRVFANALVAGAILLPSTTCIGATFPFAVRVLARDEFDAASASARVYSWNTVGSILGAIGAGYFLIPAVGFASTILLAVTLNLGLAAFVAWKHGGTRWPVAGVAALATLFCVAVSPPRPPWKLLQTSPILLTPPDGEVQFYAVGRGATVLVRSGRGAYYLSTNGLPESVILPPGGRATQYGNTQWMAALPSLAREHARTMLVVGLGGGVAVESVPPTIERFDVVELETEVVEANRSLSSLRARDPLADPRLRLIVNDARSALMLSRERYDGIVSQPSHPWTAGASHLYTREFFQLASDHLSDDGLLVQWMGLSFVDPDLLRILIATLVDVFPHVEVYEPSPGGVLMVASRAPIDIAASGVRALRAAPGHYQKMGLFRAEDLIAAQRLDSEGARAFAKGALVNTDDRNWLQMRSPAIVREGLTNRNWDEVFAPYDRLARAEIPWNRAYLTRRLSSVGLTARSRRVAAAAPVGLERDLATGLVQLGSGAYAQGRAKLRRVLEADPEQPEARAALLSLEHSAARAQGERLETPRPDGTLGLVWDAWQVEAGDARALEAHEAALATIAPDDPIWPEAIRLRARWRLQRREPAFALEAIELLDTMLTTAGTLNDLAMRAQAAAIAAQWKGSLLSLIELTTRLRPNAGHKLLARQGLALLLRYPAETVPPRLRENLLVKLRRVAGAPGAGTGQ